MRSMSSGLLAHYQGDVLTVANCIKLTLADGSIKGFTGHDFPISGIPGDGTTYLPIGEVGYSALSQSSDTGVDTFEATGSLRVDGIPVDDIRAGKYNFMKMELFQVNYENVTDGKVVYLTGRSGELKIIDDDNYSIEFRSLTQLIKQVIGYTSQSTCRVKRLGDLQCKVTIASYRWTGTISSIISVSDLVLAMTPSGTYGVDDYFTYGILKMTSGPNNGLSREIKIHIHNYGGDSGKQEVKLRMAFPWPVSAAETFQIEAGCDRSLSACKNKFSNVVNFRGEPHLPGNESTTQVFRPGTSS